ncbi:MAG TPA: Rossmann-like and DUF2520 domain-containing protein [Burkholderiales bacterium]|nr:Rossmann-like and DUF2520 domain-containing protein [Burkholderiales bacterium]
MKTLNVVGAGRVGRTLASLWEEKHDFVVQDVLDGTPEGARAAVVFIGDGNAVQAVAEMHHADVWMIATPDRAIASAADSIAAAGVLRAGDIVFHCSGSIASAALAAASRAGASVASVHPLKTFADARDAVRSFTGTYCAAEGDRAALDVLVPAFERIGARVCEIDPAFKTIYHAASVVVCNYLVALLETGFRCYEKAGLTRETASAMIEPIVRETLENVLKLGTAKALTGPIARGDDAVVRGHLEALGAWDDRIARIYRDLGAVAVEVASERAELDAHTLQRLTDALR